MCSFFSSFILIFQIFSPFSAECGGLSENTGGAMSFQDVIDSDIITMKCKICRQSVPSDQFSSHSCLNTPTPVLTGTIEPVVCPQCGKTFKNRNSLKVHKSTYHRQANVNKVSTGTRLTSLADVEFGTSFQSQQPKQDIQHKEEEIEPSQFVQVKVEPSNVTIPTFQSEAITGTGLGINVPQQPPQTSHLTPFTIQTQDGDMKQQPLEQQLHPIPLLQQSLSMPTYFGDIDSVHSKYFKKVQKHEESMPE